MQGIMVKSKTIKYLQFYKFEGLHLKSCEANCGDKVIIKISGKVVSGELYQVGSKYIYLKVAPDRFCGSCQRFYHNKYLIEDIEKLAVYPKGYQKLGVEKCVGGITYGN